MDLFKSIGSALSFSNTGGDANAGGTASSSSKQNNKKSTTAPGAASGTTSTPGSAAVTSNPFGAAFGDVNAGGAGGGGIASPKATRSSSGSKARKGKEEHSASPSAKRTSSSSSKSGVASKTTGNDNNESKKKKDIKTKEKEGVNGGGGSSSLSGGIERAWDSVSRSIGKTLNFKSDPAAAATSSTSAAGGGGSSKRSGGAAFVPTGAATFAKFDVGPQAGGTQALPPSAPPPDAGGVRKRATSATAPSPGAAGGVFGTPPAETFSSMASSKAASSRRQADGTTTAGNASDATTVPPSSLVIPQTLQGTSRAKYQGTSVIQGNTVHFLIVAVQRDPSDDAARALALIGLLDPLGAVRASTKATVQRCDAIRRLERVKIAPREAEIALLPGGGKSDPLLVDPAHGSLMGVLIPYLKRSQGVSAVDGFRTEYWSASDAAGQHRAPLFDVEGAVDELNAMAVLRLRTHTLKAEDATFPAGGRTTSDVSTQSLDEARSLLQDDFEHELSALKLDQKRETDALHKEIDRLRAQVEWKRTEVQEVKTAAEAREAAMVAEIAELKRQHTQRVVGTQTTVMAGGDDNGATAAGTSSVASAAAGQSAGVGAAAQDDAASVRSGGCIDLDGGVKQRSSRRSADEPTTTVPTATTVVPVVSRAPTQHNTAAYDRRTAHDHHHHNQDDGYRHYTQEPLEQLTSSSPTPSAQRRRHNDATAQYVATHQRDVPVGSSATPHFQAHQQRSDGNRSRDIDAADPLRCVREKLARSEAYLAEARRRTTATQERPREALPDQSVGYNGERAAVSVPAAAIAGTMNVSATFQGHRDVRSHAVRPATVGGLKTMQHQ